MPNYSLNKLILSLSKEICEMEMPGFDQAVGDDFWSGKGDFDIEFEECTVAVKCSIEKTFIMDTELETRIVYVDKIWLQLPNSEKYLTVEEITKIEEGLKL